MWGDWINKLNHLPCWLIDETLASQNYAFINRMIQRYESYQRIYNSTPKHLYNFTSRLLFRIIICSIERASSEWRVLTAWNSPTVENTEIETGHKTDSNWIHLKLSFYFRADLFLLDVCNGNCFETLPVVLSVVEYLTGSDIMRSS